MMRLADQIALVLAAAWAGALWAIGYLAAPALFQALPGDRMLAGVLAGALFARVALLGMVCGGFLLAHAWMRDRAAAARRGYLWIVLAMLALTLIGHFGIQPEMAALKAQVLPDDVMQSAVRDRFVLWHGVASVLYLAESLLAVALVLRVRQRAS